MAANDVYQLKTRYTPATTGETRRFSIRPGPISFIALVLAGLSALAWLQNVQIVVWMLERDLTDEGSAGSMLGSVRTAALITGTLALAASWRVFATGAMLLYSLRPVRAFTARMSRVLAPVAWQLFAPFRATYAAFRVLSNAVFNHVRTGVTVIASAIEWSIQKVMSGLAIAGERVIAAVSIPVRAAGSALSYAGRRIKSAADAVGGGIAGGSTAVWDAGGAVVGALVRGFGIVVRPVIAAVGLVLALTAVGVIRAGVQISRVVVYALGALVTAKRLVLNTAASWLSFIYRRAAMAGASVRMLILNVVDRISAGATSAVTVLGLAIASVYNAVAISTGKVAEVFVLTALTIRIGAVAVTSPVTVAVARAARFFRELAERSLTAVRLSAIALASQARHMATASVKRISLVIHLVVVSVLAAVVLSANAAWAPVAMFFRHVALASTAVVDGIWVMLAMVSRAASTGISSLAMGSGHLIAVPVGSARSAFQTSAAHTGHFINSGWRVSAGAANRGWAALSRVTFVAGAGIVAVVRVMMIALTSVVLFPFVWLVRVSRAVLRAIGVLTARIFWSVTTGTWRAWEWTSAAYRLFEAGVAIASKSAYRTIKVPIVYASSSAVGAANGIVAVASSVTSEVADVARLGGGLIGTVAREVASVVASSSWHTRAAVKWLAIAVTGIVAALAKPIAVASGVVMAMVASAVTRVSDDVRTVVRTASSMAAAAIAGVFRNMALAGATVLAALTFMWNAVRAGAVFVLNTVRAGLAVPAGLIASLSSAVTQTINSGGAAIWHGVSTTLAAMTRIFATAGTTTGEGILLVASGSSFAAVIATRPVRVALLTLGRHFYNAGETVWDSARWALLNLKIFSLRTRHAASQGATFLARTLFVGTGTAPDIVRFTALTVRNQKGVSAMTESNLNQSRLLSLVVTIVIFSLLAAIPIRIFWPEPPEPTVTVAHWATGHLTREGLLKEMAVEFNDAGHRTDSGTRIKIEVYDAPSELQGKYVSELIRFGTRRNLHQETNGYMVENVPDPTIVTPSSAHWLVTLNHEVGRDVADLKESKSIVSPVIGIVTYTEMARCLGWPENQIGYQDIIDLRDNPLGWRAYDCADPSWGEKPLLAFTDPTTSSTGRSLHLALYSIAAGKPPESLVREDITNPDVIEYVKKFQGLIDHYQIGTTVLNTKIYQGPQYGHFFVMPEDNLIHLYEGTERAYLNGIKTTAPAIEPGSMVMIYPKEGSMPRRNCACVVNADWVSNEQKEAAGLWTEFIREDEQQRAFMASGFRPGTELDMSDPLNRAASKITTEFGLDPDTPTPELNPSLTPSQVAADIDANWETVKRSGIVTFVVDTSGSMLGSKIELAKEGLTGAMSNMASNNSVGLVTFDDTVNVNLPIGPMEDRKWDVTAAAREMRARGETALFDAIEVAVSQTDVAEGPENAIRGVVVLTDGRANAGTGRLDRIAEMGTRFETEIRTFDGHDGSVAIDDRNSRYEITDVIGLGDAMGTEHEVQIFFIGIGDDADVQVGRILAEATGAEFVGVAEEDLAQVLEEFSKYF